MRRKVWESLYTFCESMGWHGLSERIFDRYIDNEGWS